MRQIKIPGELYHCFEAAGYRQHYEVNEDIYMRGDDAGHIYFIRKGRVRACYVTSQGRKLTYEVIEKGRIFGKSSLLSQCARSVYMATVTQVGLMVCDLDQLYVYTEQSPGLMQIILQLLSNTCSYSTAQLRRVTLYDRYQRIANLLLSETVAPGYDCGITSSSVPYTQENLTLISSLNRITVNRVLSEWRKRGIMTASCGKTMILRRTSLETLFPAASPKHLTR